MDDARALVAVAVVSYRRERQLERLLCGLAEVDAPGAPLVVIVVDNDPDESAAATVDTVASATAARLDIRYVVEPRPGIAAARNAAVHAARDFRFVAFIDDDEVPERRWLGALLQAQSHHDADVVAGPVVPEYAPDVPRWVRRGGFFAPRSHPDGQQLRQAGTNNCLIRLSALDEFGDQPFDETFGLSGGEDTLLTLRMHQQGHTLVWAADAAVGEDVPRDRARVSWLVRRALRTENSGARAELLIADQKRLGRERARAALQGIRMLVVGGAAGPIVGGLWSRAGWVRSIRLAARGVGRLAAAGGWRYLEYRRDGSAWVRR